VKSKKIEIQINLAQTYNFVDRLLTNPGLKAGVKKGNSVSMGFSPNNEHVMIASGRDRDVKV
jgi:hypothetical protein